MTETETLVDLAWLQPYLLKPKLPKAWALKEMRFDGAAWYNAAEHMSVILSGAVQSDGKRWLHVSCARRAYIPTYGDITWMKETFLGPDVYAVMVFPPRSLHVNIHNHTVHLFSCVDGHYLPEFSGFVDGVPMRTL